MHNCSALLRAPGYAFAVGRLSSASAFGSIPLRSAAMQRGSTGLLSRRSLAVSASCPTEHAS